MAPEPAGLRLLEARTQAFRHLLPGIVLFTFVDVVLLVGYFWFEAPQAFLVGWGAVMTGWCVLWGLAPPRDSAAQWPWFAFSVGEALLFVTFLIVVLPGASPERAVVLMAFVIGLLAAGALSKMSLPRQALTFVGVFTPGAVIALLGSPLPDVWVPTILLVAFGLALSVLLKTMSSSFDARVKAEEDLDRQKTLVSHLLNDFEESASEGLWELDARGRLTTVSPRLSELFGIAATELVGQPLAPWTDLGPTLEQHTAFRNLVVPVEVGGQRRWWSLSGKPLKDLEGHIIGWRGVGADISGVRQQELETMRLSRFDSLTGLLNRHAFRHQLDGVLAPNLPRETRCLVLVDLIGFKDVNESRGHALGDALLQAVAGRLRQSLPETVMVARLDGDEFALLATLVASREEILGHLNRLLAHLVKPYVLAGDRLEAGFRMGFSLSPRDARSPDQWLRCADLALRSAKARGRNQIVEFTADLLEAFRFRNGLQDDLRDAQGRGEMSLVYQPLVHLGSGKITGFEALLRWTHPTRGAVPPAAFIPLAEENETILTLGLWVIETACREARSWPPEISVSVNVSGVQLRSGTLDGEVGAILERLAFDPCRLVLEVTESALIKDNRLAGITLQALKKRGVRLALDDFGTGYSALAYLQSFPFDKLKIDQTFVKALAEQDRSRSLLGAIVGLARSLGLSTTAEGIEDPEHLAILRQLGCDEGQGYLFSRPVPPNDVSRLLGLILTV